MTINERIKLAKNAFKTTYADKDPAIMGITAAYQRASLYTPGGNNKDIREEWAKQLHQITKKYNKTQSIETFIKDVENLAKHMNSSFPGRFKNGKNGYEDVFRIAHAQKSLSVCLKHMWIQGEPHFAIPPVCPVDGIMLKYVHNGDAWTKVNSISDRKDGKRGYLSHLSMMEEAAKKEGFQTIPEWEVVVWYESMNKNRENVLSSKSKSTIKRTRTKERADNNLVPGRKNIDIADSRFITYQGAEFYVFAGRNGSGPLCEVYSPNGTYAKEDEIRVKGLNVKGGQKPYYIKYFKTGSLTDAIELEKQIIELF